MAACVNIASLMHIQADIMRRHLPEHQYLRGHSDRHEAEESFVADYSWLIREMHCAYICDQRSGCEHASRLAAEGDLLRQHQHG